MHETRISAAGYTFTFALETVADEPLEARAEVETISADTHLIHYSAARADGQPLALRDLSIRWDAPAVDMHGYYGVPPSPEELTRLPFWWVRKRAAANTGAPFVSLFHRSGENRAAFGLLDQLTETGLDANLSEATRCYHFHWHKPGGAMPTPPGAPSLDSARRPAETWLKAERWRETLFVCTARRPWSEVLREYTRFVDERWPQPRLPVPECAFDPVFCTWTAIHHDVSQEWILRNAPLAAALGFGTWLTDDGWFTEKATFANYAYAGDWLPCASKFPDFIAHVRAVQDLGMRYVLWTAPFMIGDKSAAATRYAPLLAQHIDRLQFSNLSPWKAETRQIVADLLERLVRDYGLDGLKLDFIDSVALDIPQPPDADYPSRGAGIYDILSYAVERLAAERPELLIEFRNSYTNLAARRYGNLYRASDVPINFTANRWQAATLRLLAPDRAVHFDPAIWHPDDTLENVAVYLINAIVSVPMISVELDKYPQSHLDLIRHWLGFYRAHRETIVHGTFAPEFRLGQIPLIRFGGQSERIIGVYDDIAFALGQGEGTLWILNASSRPYVELLGDGFRGARMVTRRDKFGRVVGEERVAFPVARLDVEVGGSLEIT
jgi:alpha-galactosidase